MDMPYVTKLVSRNHLPRHKQRPERGRAGTHSFICPSNLSPSFLIILSQADRSISELSWTRKLWLF